MKNTKTLIYTCIVLTFLNVFNILFYSCRNNKSLTEVSNTSSPSTTVFTDAPTPNIFALAGEEVPLQRVDIQESFRKELIVNSYLHSHTIQILQNAPRIFSLIEPILKENGIPDDFKYLAVIESRLDPQIVSPAGATGIWQLMKNTAEELGLEINDEVDERYHIEKSTRAAAAYLKKSYEKFGSWTLAAASYNAGSAMISRQMNIQKEKDYYNLLLGEETGRYVFRILALKQIMNHPELYDFKINYIYPTEKIQKIEVNGSINDWADFAQEQGITYKTLKRFNPWLRKNDLKNVQKKTYEISIPENKKGYK
ncbi:MAG: lytic transglycosylase domain-containing protein [Odoribacter sp.]